MNELLKGAGNIVKALANLRANWGVRISERLDVTAVLVNNEPLPYLTSATALV